MIVRPPDAESLERAREQFDKENKETEAALTILFSDYRRNDSLPHVLLKVVALNKLYTTNILAVHDVAQHIHKNHEKIDAGLAAGDPDVVDLIVRVLIERTGKFRSNWSFATKYCSWHNKDCYPIWDSRVDAYLKALRNTEYGKFIKPRGELWNRYAEFVDLVRKLQIEFKLDGISFKDLDKFMFSAGEEIMKHKESAKSLAAAAPVSE